ncbi:unnamed protein product [Cercopithifilaria johnstoni]|uniref:Uncharacterized protein n=1 Tax=Cercopithifilaria johnstoni TaxID=2874296 RepID=A0A8J2MFG8_9BILA|nr:unnamed protein product [Cercopithifilaria johnstoni]
MHCTRCSNPDSEYKVEQITPVCKDSSLKIQVATQTPNLNEMLQKSVARGGFTCMGAHSTFLAEACALDNNIFFSKFPDEFLIQKS